MQYSEGSFLLNAENVQLFFTLSDLASALSESHLKGQEIQPPNWLSKSKEPINSFRNLALLTP